jgi:hypothetical protein
VTANVLEERIATILTLHGLATRKTKINIIPVPETSKATLL